MPRYRVIQRYDTYWTAEVEANSREEAIAAYDRSESQTLWDSYATDDYDVEEI